jgi:hypothetical protein
VKILHQLPVQSLNILLTHTKRSKMPIADSKQTIGLSSESKTLIDVELISNEKKNSNFSRKKDKKH